MAEMIHPMSPGVVGRVAKITRCSFSGLSAPAARLATLVGSGARATRHAVTQA